MSFTLCRGLRLIEREEEVCIFYEKVNIEGKILFDFRIACLLLISNYNCLIIRRSVLLNDVENY